MFFMAVEWAHQQNNFLGSLNSRGGFNSWSILNSSWGSSNSSNWGNSWDKSGKGSNNWGMVDDVLGGVVGHVLLDRDLGNVLNLVVDLVANMLDNWGSGNSIGSNRGSNSLDSNWGSNSLDLSSLDSNWGSNSMDSWGSNSISSNSWGSNSLHFSGLNSNWGSSIGNSWGSNSMDSNSLANGINKSILVKVFGESLKGN